MTVQKRMSHRRQPHSRAPLRSSSPAKKTSSSSTHRRRAQRARAKAQARLRAVPDAASDDDAPLTGTLLAMRLGPPQTAPVKRRPKRAGSLLTAQARRTRWAAVAEETHTIVTGAGTYVDARTPMSPTSPTTPAFSSASVSDPATAVDADAAARPSHPPIMASVAHNISTLVDASKRGTTFYPHYSEELARWPEARASSPSASTSPQVDATKTVIEFTRSSTLAAARRLIVADPSLHSLDPSLASSSTHLGVLSFASPKRPGGSYLHGADDQEARIARSSSLVASLAVPAAEAFYAEHRRMQDGSGLHDHSMVYMPGVVVLRKQDDEVDGAGHPQDPSPSDGDSDTDDDSALAPAAAARLGAFAAPLTVNVLSAVPVNAAAVRAKHAVDPALLESGVRQAMRERMARVLRVFEARGERALVLGAFGCGSSEIAPEVVADIWAELLFGGEDAGSDEEGKEEMRRPARFAGVFEKVVFAVPGRMFVPFRRAFEMRVFEEEVVSAMED